MIHQTTFYAQCSHSGSNDSPRPISIQIIANADMGLDYYSIVDGMLISHFPSFA